jgi:hypothetical protein
MSEEIIPDEKGPDNVPGNVPDISALVEAAVSERLKDIKSKLDNAYNARDEANKKLAEIEQEKREAELKRLQEEGKHKEAYEMQLSEEKAKREALEKRNVELTRDLQVRDVLREFSFQSAKAAELAQREISESLVRTETGQWVHSSGKSIAEFTQAYAQDEANAFLFVQTRSTGASLTPAVAPPSSSNKSLFEMTQAEVMKLAAEGKLPHQR